MALAVLKSNCKADKT